MVDYVASLERDVAAQTQWSVDMTALATRGVPAEMLDELLALGAGGADQVRQMAAMDDGTLAKLIERWRAT